MVTTKYLEPRALAIPVSPCLTKFFYLTRRKVRQCKFTAIKLEFEFKFQRRMITSFGAVCSVNAC